MRSVECYGHEVSLEDCKVDWASKECDHKRDVSVDCDFKYNQGIVWGNRKESIRKKSIGKKVSLLSRKKSIRKKSISFNQIRL